MSDLDIVERTGALKRAAYWSPFSDFASHDWGMLLLQTLRSISGAPGKAPPMTPSVNGQIDQRLNESIHNPRLLTARTLEEFVAQWLGGDSYFVTVGHLAAWNESLHDLAYESVVQPLLRGEGLIGGVDVYAVLGNCGATPFGVHCDDEPVFIAHCGPNPKEVWYSCTAPAGPGAGDAAQWMEEASHRVMQTGDVVFIPTGTYHLLRSHGFGTSVGFSVFPPNPDGLADRQRRLRSNGYLVTPPVLRSTGHSDAARFSAVRGSRVEWCPAPENQVAVFMRGRKVLFPDAPWLAETLRLLAGPGDFNAGDLAAVTSHPEVSRRILSLALDLGAVRSVEAPHGRGQRGSRP